MIKQFGSFVKQIKKILKQEGLYSKWLEVEQILFSNSCDGVSVLLEEIYTIIEDSGLEILIANAFSVKLQLLDNIEAVINHRLSFKFWRFLGIWSRNIGKIIRGYLILDLAGRLL